MASDSHVFVTSEATVMAVVANFFGAPKFPTHDDQNDEISL